MAPYMGQRRKQGRAILVYEVAILGGVISSLLEPRLIFTKCKTQVPLLQKKKEAQKYVHACYRSSVALPLELLPRHVPEH
jgi:hypothetical protein